MARHLTPFTLSLSKGAPMPRSCFHKLSTNGLVVSILRYGRPSQS